MNKIIVVLCVMLAVSCYAKDKSEAEIVVVNMAKLVQMYPGTESSELILKEQVEEFENEKDDMMKKLEDKQEALQKLAAQSEDPAFSDEMIASKRKEVEKEVVEFRQYRQDIMERLKLRQQQIGDEKRRLQKRIFDDLSKVVAEYSEKKGYTMVIDVSAIIYNKGNTDITEEILKIVEKKKD